MKKSNTPIKIGTKIVKNRITFAPTVKFGWSDNSGIANERFARHYEERAAGGTGLIVVEATCVTPDGRLAPSQLGLWEDRQIAGHKAITEACHKYGTVMLVQIHHGGFNTHPECGPSKGPSVVQWPRFRETVATEAFTREEVIEIRNRFIEAAVRAQKAGYDGVQLHACHSYLINQFVSPVINTRNDEYGGSRENRLRFPLEIVRGIREACGNDFIISSRTTVMEPTLEEAYAIADAYIEAGVDYIQGSTGIAPLSPDYAEGEERSPYNKVVRAGTLMHKHIGGRVPVSVVNGILTPELANLILDQGLADTIDAARALLADPNWARAVTGEADYVHCRDCKFCLWSPFMPHKCPAVSQRHEANPDCTDYS
jgi:2,4-dienoyl-CoA reductase-like NADH-dependent reductase (Old Yellow Enzyme family)